MDNIGILALVVGYLVSAVGCFAFLWYDHFLVRDHIKLGKLLVVTFIALFPAINTFIAVAAIFIFIDIITYKNKWFSKVVYRKKGG